MNKKSDSTISFYGAMPIPISGHDPEVSWQQYVDEMKHQKPEQYLAGDMEGYQRGYTDGSKVGERSATDLTLAGALIIALIAGALGILIGLNLAAF